MTVDSGIHDGLTSAHRRVGRIAALSVFVLGVAYAVVTALGFRSLDSPQAPIGPPSVTLMELLILPLAALYLVTVAAVHVDARSGATVYSLIALVFTTAVATLTTSVHLVILAVGPHLDATGQSWVPWIISFRWPSILYALDILARDWFFALSLLFESVAFTGSTLDRAVRILLIVSAVLSLAGLVGVPLSDMQIRNVGVLGYAVVSPVAFLLVGISFGRPRTAPASRGQVE